MTTPGSKRPADRNGQRLYALTYWSAHSESWIRMTTNALPYNRAKTRWANLMLRAKYKGLKVSLRHTKQSFIQEVKLPEILR